MIESVALAVASKFADYLGEPPPFEHRITTDSKEYRVLLNPVAHIGAGMLLPSIDYSEIKQDPAFLEWEKDTSGNLEPPSYHAVLRVTATRKPRGKREVIVVIGLMNGNTEFFSTYDESKSLEEFVKSTFNGYFYEYPQPDEDRLGGLYILQRGA